MKILITGGSGFLGRHLTNKLVSAGHSVILMSRNHSKKQESTNVIRVTADINDKTSLRRVLSTHPEIDAIVHMAALVPTSKEMDTSESMFQTNVQGTINVLEVFGKKIHNFVYASTAEVYGLPQSNHLINELDTPSPLSYYGASKLAGEYFSRVYESRHSNLKVTILRFTVLYGPGDRINRAIPNFINKAITGDTLEVYGGEELRDYLYVDDAAKALYLAVIAGTSGIFNIGTGVGVSIQDTASAIIEATGSKAKIAILNREKPASNIVLDIKNARERLHFKPHYKFPELIEEQIEWHRHN